MLKIVTSLDVAKESGYETVADWLLHQSKLLVRRGVCPVPCTGKAMDSDITASVSVNHGRWLGLCPWCGKNNYVDPKENLFYCFSCGNNGTGQMILAEFPKNYQEIEKVLLKRAVHGAEQVQNLFIRATQVEPSIPGLYRNWRPGESLAELREQNNSKGLE